MIIRTTILVLGCAIATVGACLAGSPSENKTLVEGFVSVGNSRELDRLSEFVSEGFVRHCQVSVGLGARGNLVKSA